MDHSLEVNLVEKDLMDLVEVNQEEMGIEMEIDPDLDHHQDRKVNWQRM